MFRRIKSSHGDWPWANKPRKGFPPRTALAFGRVVVVVMIDLLNFLMGLEWPELVAPTRFFLLFYAREDGPALHRRKSCFFSVFLESPLLLQCCDFCQAPFVALFVS